MTDTKRLRSDLSKHLQDEIGQVITRHLTMADRMLPHADVLLIFAEAAVGVAMSATASCAASVKSEAAPGAVDSAIELIVTMIRASRDECLAGARTAEVAS